MPHRSFVIFVTALLLTATPVFADLSSLLQSVGVSKKTSINDTPLASGLKEALRVGIDKTVQALDERYEHLLAQLVTMARQPEKWTA